MKYDVYIKTISHVEINAASEEKAKELVYEDLVKSEQIKPNMPIEIIVGTEGKISDERSRSEENN